MDGTLDEAGAQEQSWDWDPVEEQVQRDQVAAYDELRERCPIARSESLGWSLLSHVDVLEALADHTTFSSRVSTHVAVPNGMDPPEHTAFRAVVDRCYAPDLVDAFAPVLQEIASELVGRVVGTDEVDIVTAIAEPFAARSQCSYLGWPAEVAVALQDWAADSTRATRTRDRGELIRVAGAFDEIIVGMLDRQRAAGTGTPRGLMGQLLEERVEGELLSDGQLVSMLRNWTAGEVGTITAAVGIIVEFLARRQDVQQLLRTRPDLHQTAMDEMLRLEAPLISNRRRTTRPVTVRGRTIPSDQPVTILWPSVQRDPDTFEDPTEFRLDRAPADNLLYGRGPHYCPGEGLSRLELGILLDELLRAVPGFRLAPSSAPVRAIYPSGGFSEVRITVAD